MPKTKFLLDENVRVELAQFLKSKNFDIKLVPKSAGDAVVASISKNEERILVTNDQDFLHCGKDKIFSLIWLRIPQNDSKLLLKSFDKLLKECNYFVGNIILLEPGKWESTLLEEDY